jgi:hypothetical protein
MMRYTALGTLDDVRGGLMAFADHCGADELMVACGGPTAEDRLYTLERVADAAGYP